MSNQEIVQKLWNLCNVLRDDGITYHQYVTELTYILFLKMMQETGREKDILKNISGLSEFVKVTDTLTNDEVVQKLTQQLESIAENSADSEKQSQAQIAVAEKIQIAKYSWDVLAKKSGTELQKYYTTMLRLFGEHCIGHIRDIYSGARSNIDKPKNLEKIVKAMDDLDWYSVETDNFGDLYEGLLEKNANEKKSGAGQYFTPRVLIDVMVRLTEPKIRESCNDPACGTFGFMIAANSYVKEHNDVFSMSDEDYSFQKSGAFTGCELVFDTRRLALMNAMIHGLEGEIHHLDSLSSAGEKIDGFDVILTNPPFGTKQGGERATRSLTFPTSNKQLNFLQVIYRTLKKTGTARAAVVLPDNVLFADGEGAKIREDLMDKCDLHTVLRLPTGIFYAQGVKTNVLFFTRGKTEKGNTSEVWFYDMRTNMPSFGKTTPLKAEHFAGFEAAYTAEDRSAVTDDRWSKFTRDEIRAKHDSLDLGLIRDDSVLDYEDLADPIDSGEEMIDALEEAVDLIKSVVKELRHLQRDESGA